MKQSVAGAALAVLLFCISCNDTGSTNSTTRASDSSTIAPPPPPKEPSQADKNTDNIKAIYKGIETGDMSAMDAFVANDAVDHSGPHGEIKGLDSIKKALADMHNHISDMKIELIASATDGDYHFALSRFTGKTKVAMMGTPANTSIDDTSVDVEKIVNGKITDHWGYEKPQMRDAHDKHKSEKK